MRVLNPATNVLDSFYWYVASYNSFNNPDTLHFDSYSNGQWGSQTSTRIYRYQNVTGLPDIKKETVRLTAYPNPAGSVINLKVQNDDAAVVSVLDVNGRMMQQTSIKGRDNQLSLENLPSGTYTIRYESKQAIGTIKLVRR